MERSVLWDELHEGLTRVTEGLGEFIRLWNLAWDEYLDKEAVDRWEAEGGPCAATQED